MEGRPGVQGGARRPAPRLHRWADSAVPREAAVRAVRRGADLDEARGACAHRRAQDQQRHRPGVARDEARQEAHHRGDGSGPARRRDGRGVLPARPRVHRVHGSGRLRAPEAQLLPHDRDGSQGRPRAVGLAHAQGCSQRGPPRLGDQHPYDALHHRLGRGAASLPGHRARPAVSHRQRGARPDAQPDHGRDGAPHLHQRPRPPPGRRGGMRWRRIERHRHVLGVPQRHTPVQGGEERARANRRRRGGRRARPMATGRHRDGQARSDAHQRRRRCAARLAHLPAADQGRADQGDALHLGRARLPRRRPTACAAQVLGQG
mmetsp:Transcript_129734/g.361374  ORF Transcript_129734/g.361374 Transcript_129734/m.361374 type:complete len:319 (-) Transcript_129734:498-1454(-)